MLVIVGLLVLYIVVRDMLSWTHPPGPNPAPSANRQDVKPAGQGSSQARGTNQSNLVAVRAENQEGSFVPPTSSSTSQSGRQRLATAALPAPSVPTVPSAPSIFSPGPSFVQKFSELKVNLTRSRLSSPAGASSGVSYAGPATRSVTRGATPSPGPHTGSTTRSATRGATSSLTPLMSPPSTPPSTPTPSPSPTSTSTSSPAPTFSQTPTTSRRRPGPVVGGVDFSMYKKKTRILTKTPKKPQTKAAGKLPAEAVDDVTITTWFYKTTSESKLLLDTPPNLTGHPEGIDLGDIYFDRAGDAYRLWLWCADEVGVVHWKKVPFGYQRHDGKRLIVTPKILLLSWVAPSYYKQVGSGEGLSVSEDGN